MCRGWYWYQIHMKFVAGADIWSTTSRYVNRRHGKYVYMYISSSTPHERTLRYTSSRWILDGECLRNRSLLSYVVDPTWCGRHHSVVYHAMNCTRVLGNTCKWHSLVPLKGYSWRLLINKAIRSNIEFLTRANIILSNYMTVCLCVKRLSDITVRVFVDALRLCPRQHTIPLHQARGDHPQASKLGTTTDKHTH